jgi:hypothetical protein
MKTRDPNKKVVSGLEKRAGMFLSKPGLSQLIGTAFGSSFGGPLGAAIGAEFGKDPSRLYKGNVGMNAAVGQKLGSLVGPRTASVLSQLGAKSVPSEHKVTAALKRIKRMGKPAQRQFGKLMRLGKRNNKLTLAITLAAAAGAGGSFTHHKLSKNSGPNSFKLPSPERVD